MLQFDRFGSRFNRVDRRSAGREGIGGSGEGTQHVDNHDDILGLGCGFEAIEKEAAGAHRMANESWRVVMNNGNARRRKGDDVQMCTRAQNVEEMRC